LLVGKDNPEDHILVHVCLPENTCLTPIVVPQNEECGFKIKFVKDASKKNKGYIEKMKRTHFFKPNVVKINQEQANSTNQAGLNANINNLIQNNNANNKLNQIFMQNPPNPEVLGKRQNLKYNRNINLNKINNKINSNNDANLITKQKMEKKLQQLRQLNILRDRQIKYQQSLIEQQRKFKELQQNKLNKHQNILTNNNPIKPNKQNKVLSKASKINFTQKIDHKININDEYIKILNTRIDKLEVILFINVFRKV